MYTIAFSLSSTLSDCVLAVVTFQAYRLLRSLFLIPLSLLLSFLLIHATVLAQPLPADSLTAPNGALHLRLALDAQGV